MTRPEPEMWPLTRLGTMTPEASEAILPDKLDSTQGDLLRRSIDNNNVKGREFQRKKIV